MADSFNYDVFLSHNRQDKPRVRALAERLRDAGLRVWLDDWVIKPGMISTWPSSAAWRRRGCSCSASRLPPWARIGWRWSGAPSSSAIRAMRANSMPTHETYPQQSAG